MVGRPWSFHTTGRRAVGALALVLTLASCGAPSYRYLKNDGDKTYLRMPRAWGVLDAQTAAAQQGDTLPVPWQRVFDAARPADQAHAELAEPDQVIGRLTVFYVNAKTADGLSAGALRAALSPLDVDPVEAADASDAAKGALRDFKVEAREGGLRGSRVVYTVQTESGGTVVFDQTTLLDPKAYPNPLSGAAMFKVFALSLHCTTSCYDKAKSDIDDVVTSWTVVP